MLVWPLDPRYRRYVVEEIRRVFSNVEHDIALRPSGYPFVPTDLYDAGANGECMYVVDCPTDMMTMLVQKR